MNYTQAEGQRSAIVLATMREITVSGRSTIDSMQRMHIREAIGKTITNIYSRVKMEVGGLDEGECFIELDNKIVIDIPFDGGSGITIKKVDKKAVSLFSDLSDYPVYQINKENKTIAEVAEKYQRRKRSLFNKLKDVFFGSDAAMKEYQSYQVEYRENKLKYIRDRKILDFVWYAEDNEKGLFLLDNGYLITEICVAPHGTGLAGLNYYENLDALAGAKGSGYLKITQMN